MGLVWDDMDEQVGIAGVHHTHIGHHSLTFYGVTLTAARCNDHGAALGTAARGQ